MLPTRCCVRHGFYWNSGQLRQQRRLCGGSHATFAMTSCTVHTGLVGTDKVANNKQTSMRCTEGVYIVAAAVTACHADGPDQVGR